MQKIQNKYFLNLFLLWLFATIITNIFFNIYINGILSIPLLISSSFSIILIISNRFINFEISNKYFYILINVLLITSFYQAVNYLWIYDLDDKWVYYSISKIILTHGLPLWNSQENILVGASFLYPYLLAPGNFFGGLEAWDVYQKILGLSLTLLSAFIIYKNIKSKVLSILALGAFLLWEPLIQWSMGALETPLAVLVVTVLTISYLKNGIKSKVFLFLTGLLIFIRPDAILIGVGVFIIKVISEPRKFKELVLPGLFFSTPILIFLGFNLLKFGHLLPLVFYVKGWNCVYCGNDPIWERILIGGTHLLSGLSCSFIGLFFITIFLKKQISFLISKKGAYENTFIIELLFGIFFYLCYHVIGGYQHMNFTFRYFIPGIASLIIISFYYFDNHKSDLFILSNKNILILLLIQISILFSTSYVAKNIDIGLTIVKKDSFSILSYRSFLESWKQSGIDLSKIVKGDDRIFLYQGMMTGAFTNGYLIDQFYFKTTDSKYPDIKRCQSQPNNQANCLVLYDYIFTFTDPKYWPDTHHKIGDYQTITILKRNSLPRPNKPLNLNISQISTNHFLLTWDKSFGEFEYNINTKDSSKSIIKHYNIPPGYTHLDLIFEAKDLKPSTIEINACNYNGCSDFNNIATTF